MPTSARWAAANLPKISEKTVHPAGAMWASPPTTGACKFALHIHKNILPSHCFGTRAYLLRGATQIRKWLNASLLRKDTGCAGPAISAQCALYACSADVLPDAAANSPKNTVKTVHSAGPMRRPQASFEAQPRIARLLAPKMGIDPYRQVGKCIRIRPGFPKKALHPAGGQSRPPLHPSLRREIFVQGKAGAGVHTVRQVRPTRPCAERSGGVFQGFICPAGRRCRAVPDPQGIRGMRRRRWRCG